MAERETCLFADLAEGTYIVNGSVVQRADKVKTVGSRTTVIDADGESWRVTSTATAILATDTEAAEFEEGRDRERVAEGLRLLADTILRRKLPVPSSLRDVKVDFTLHDSADLSGWAEVLRRRPVKHVPSLLPSMSSDELGLDICIVGGTGEFGPDLAESVEHRDAVGALPVVRPACRGCGEVHPLNEVGRCVDCEAEAALQAIDEMRAEESQRDGWPISDGHRPQVDEDVMRADRYSGEG
jgi:hypothetical protein